MKVKKPVLTEMFISFEQNSNKEKVSAVLSTSLNMSKKNISEAIERINTGKTMCIRNIPYDIAMSQYMDVEAACEEYDIEAKIGVIVLDALENGEDLTNE